MVVLLSKTNSPPISVGRLLEWAEDEVQHLQATLAGRMNAGKRHGLEKRLGKWITLREYLRQQEAANSK